MKETDTPKSYLIENYIVVVSYRYICSCIIEADSEEEARKEFEEMAQDEAELEHWVNENDQSFEPVYEMLSDPKNARIQRFS